MQDKDDVNKLSSKLYEVQPLLLASNKFCSGVTANSSGINECKIGGIAWRDSLLSRSPEAGVQFPPNAVLSNA